MLPLAGLSPVSGKTVVAKFDGGLLSSDGAIFLLRVPYSHVGTVSVDSGCLPDLRVLSRVSPSTPSVMKRACHLHTAGFDRPDRRMISAVLQPSAVARMMLARHTCFCGALRSETIASSRWRSACVTFTTIPALMTRA
jgi:hypothetical protein